MPDKILKTIQPREYQQKIFESCKEKNCLVVLPTGMGKTLVALMLSINRLRLYPESKILFLAPTRPLAEQHLSYFKKHLPELFAHMELFTGKVNAEKRKKLWERADIIFSTPQCIGNDLKNNLYNLRDVSLLIEDECHRCLKNYSYTYVATQYKEQAKNPRILGLTASPGTDKQTITKIANNLGIESIELRTRESEDVKEYLQKLEFNAIKLEFPEEFKEIADIIKKMYEKKVEELKNRKLLFKPANKITLLETQSRIMKAIFAGNRNFNYLSGASACAQAIKLSHLIELIQTQTLYTSLEYIKSIFQQSAQNKSKAAKQIAKNPEFNKAYIKINELLAKNIEHPKLLELKSIVEESIKENPKVKIIVFSQYRDTGVRICKTLNEIQNINARVFVGQAKKTNDKGVVSGLNQKEQHEIIEKFKQGEINVMVSSSIGEEGLDIPEVNFVIFYEPIPSAIRKIQRCVPGNSKILMENGEYKLISQISKGERIISYNHKENFLEPKEVTEVFENKKKELLEIITEKGNNIKLTENHPILTSNGWVCARNLKEEDRIAMAHNPPVNIKYSSIEDFLPKETYICESNQLKETIKNSKLTYKEIQERLVYKGFKVNKKTLWGYTNKDAIPIKLFREIFKICKAGKKNHSHIRIIKSRKGNKINISKITIRELMWLTGIIASDGDLRIQSKIRKNRKIPYFTYRFRVSNTNKEILFKVESILKKLGLKVYKERDDVVSSNNTILGKIFHNLGIPVKKKSKTIELSNQLFMSSSVAIESFLAGLFDGDGNYNKGPCQIRLGTASKNFAFQLQTLLLRLGIISKVCCFDKTETRIIKGKLAKFTGNFYSVEIYKKQDVSKFLSIVDIVKVKDSCVNYKYSKDSNLEGNIFWARIKSINKVEKEKTYNLKIIDNDSYIADNIILHNCGRTARLMPGKTTILITKGTLDEIFYYASIAKEKRMYKAIESIKQDISNGKPLNLSPENEKKTEEKDKKEKQKKLF